MTSRCGSSSTIGAIGDEYRVRNYAKPTGQFWVVKEHVYIPPLSAVAP